jgi:hypothetical protein
MIAVDNSALKTLKKLRIVRKSKCEAQHITNIGLGEDRRVSVVAEYDAGDDFHLCGCLTDDSVLLRTESYPNPEIDEYFEGLC